MSNELTITDDGQVLDALEASHYPGTTRDDLQRVVTYCRVNRLDPFLKPVHIVPMRVKKAGTRNEYEWRNVLMPGIADYRIKAARSGEYAGKTEPEFGPDVTYELSGRTITVPEWCKITISRLVGGQPRAFTAKEYWIENYATGGKNPDGSASDAPNAMWQKRARGQLAKCTEAQALRMAFPEFSGGAPTAEEMEGKTIEGTAVELPRAPEPVNTAPPAPKRKWSDVLAEIEIKAGQVQSFDGLDLLQQHEDVLFIRDKAGDPVKARLGQILGDAYNRLVEAHGARPVAQNEEMPV